MSTHTPVEVNPRISRQLACPRGHDISTTDKVYVRPDGRRRCRKCAIASQERVRDRHRRGELPPPPRVAAQCSVVVCDRPVYLTGLCAGHYGRLKKYGDPGTTPIRRPGRRRRCTEDGCERPHCGRGWCRHHYYVHVLSPAAKRAATTEPS